MGALRPCNPPCCPGGASPPEAPRLNGEGNMSSVGHDTYTITKVLACLWPYRKNKIDFSFMLVSCCTARTKVDFSFMLVSHRANKIYFSCMLVWHREDNIDHSTCMCMYLGYSTCIMSYMAHGPSPLRREGLGRRRPPNAV